MNIEFKNEQAHKHNILISGVNSHVVGFRWFYTNPKFAGF